MNTTIQHIILLPGTNVIHIFHQKSKKKFIKRQLKLIVMTGLSRLDMIKHIILLPGTNVIHIFHQKSRKKKFIKRDS
jgi:ribosomal silencing factor RsfS